VFEINYSLPTYVQKAYEENGKKYQRILLKITLRQIIHAKIIVNHFK
jgi:hypothetical protein